MNVQALNAGSNTLRYKLLEVGSGERVIAAGSIDQAKGDKAVAAAEKALAVEFPTKSGQCLAVG